MRVEHRFWHLVMVSCLLAGIAPVGLEYELRDLWCAETMMRASYNLTNVEWVQTCHLKINRESNARALKQTASRFEARGFSVITTEHEYSSCYILLTRPRFKNLTPPHIPHS